MNLFVLAGPVVGAVIGYITNYIAIKMLFRPLEPKYILGRRVPFTPGIIPRRKHQLADALGNAVFKRFFGWDDLAQVLVSDTFADKISEGIEDCINNSDPKELLEKIPPEVWQSIREAFKEQVRHAMVVKGYAGLSRIISEAAADMLDTMSKNISREEISQQLSKIFSMDEIDIKPYIKDGYITFMEKYVKGVVESVDMIGIISDKLISMNPGDIEVLALDIVARELRMVVWFGALLGGLIGIINSVLYLA